MTRHGDRGLEIRAITITRAGEPLVALDARIDPGTILTVMGPSGAGKSTLLACLAGALPPAFEATGRVLLDGRDITDLPPEQRRVGMLVQDALLFPHLSVESNLLVALPPAIRPRALRLERVRTALASAGLDGLGGRDPLTLSGGQQSRVALLRTLLAEPSALLLDEPFARLDAMRRDQIRRLVLDEVQRCGLPAVLVTHDEADARAAGGPVIEIGHRADPG